MTTQTEAVPVYKAKEVPAHLRTTTQLREARLKPAPGQEPLGWLSMYRRGHGWGKFPLYDPAAAEPMRPLSAKQQAAKEARRTCPECHVVRDYIIHTGYGRCDDCRRKADRAAQELRDRTCYVCKRVSVAPLPRGSYGAPSCVPCRVRTAIREHLEREREAAWMRTCRGGWQQDCTTEIWTDEEVAAALAAGTWNDLPRRCPPCQEAWEADREQQRLADIENARLEREAHANEQRRLQDWAAAALADDLVVVLDTETTGLNHDSRIVDIAITDRHGQPLLDTLLNPGEPIPYNAWDIHGISDSMVAGAPTFTGILDQLNEVLAGRRCLIYNADYDTGRLHWELTLHHQAAGHPDPGQAATDWIAAHTFEDIMIPYSDWCGEWSDYWGNNRWQALYGGDHRALSDCRAALRQLASMTPAADEAAADPWEVRTPGPQPAPATLSKSSPSSESGG